MSEMRQLNVRIPVELAAALQAHVDGSGEKQSVVVRRGIELAIGQQAEDNPIPLVGKPSSAAESPAVAPPESPVLDAAPPEDREDGDTGSSIEETAGELERRYPELARIDFAAWVSDRAGLPKAVARKRISEGRVEVDGRARHCDLIEEKELQRVTLDGNPL